MKFYSDDVLEQFYYILVSNIEDPCEYNAFISVINDFRKLYKLKPVYKKDEETINKLFENWSPYELLSIGGEFLYGSLDDEVEPFFIFSKDKSEYYFDFLDDPLADQYNNNSIKIEFIKYIINIKNPNKDEWLVYDKLIEIMESY